MEKRKNKKTKKLSIFFILFLILTFFSISLNPLQVQSYDFNKDSGLDTSADSAGFATGAKAESVDSIIGLVIFMVLGLVGVIFFGLIILSGLKWMIAQGNEEKVKKAKESIINSLIGLAITLAAYTISYFLINYFT